MIVRGAAVVMLRSALVMVGRSVAMGDALSMRRDFPVLIGMNPLSQGQQRQAARKVDEGFLKLNKGSGPKTVQGVKHHVLTAP